MAKVTMMTHRLVTLVTVTHILYYVVHISLYKSITQVVILEYRIFTQHAIYRKLQKKSTLSKKFPNNRISRKLLMNELLLMNRTSAML